MKILLPTFFLLSFAASGQKSNIDSLAFNATVTKYLFIEYSQECYNDSTEILWKRTWDTIPDTTDPKGYREIITNVHRYYYHREPTFSGFIEWIKKNK